MTLNEYKKIVDKYTPKEDRLKNCLKATLVGGIMGVIGQALSDLYSYILEIPSKEANVLMIVTLIFIGVLLTGLGFFDRWVSCFKCGLIIPITGFAHSMMSATMEYKKEGLVTGIGANMFKLAGTVIAYGVISATLFGFLRLIIMGE